MGGEQEGCQKQQHSGGGAVDKQSEGLVSIHSIPSAHFSTWSKSCQLWESPCPVPGKCKMDSTYWLTSVLAIVLHCLLRRSCGAHN